MSTGVAIPKPAFGSPCNGCGLCCVAELCPVAEIVFPDHGPLGPCPALQWVGPLARCGMMIEPGRYMIGQLSFADGFIGEVIQSLLGSGLGCDSYGDDGRTVPEFINRRALGLTNE